MTLKIRYFPAANDASAYYRMKLPAQVLAQQGHDVARGEVGEIDTDTDVAILQRPTREADAWIVGILQEHGITVVLDLDDDFDSLAPNHAMYTAIEERKAWVHQACQMADLVTCTTPALAQRYGYGHGVVIPNYVPASMLDVQPFARHSNLMVGWTGTVASHPNDLQQTKGVLADLIGPGADFAVVGPSTSVAKALRLNRVIATGYVPLSRYPAVYASLDVAIVPLEPSPFNDAKSWLKGLEAAALGVPFVASPTAEYQRLHDLGAGELARTKKEWHQHLTRLMRDRKFRAKQGRAVKEVARTLTVEDHAWKWLDAWTDAWVASKGRVVTPPS